MHLGVVFILLQSQNAPFLVTSTTKYVWNKLGRISFGKAKSVVIKIVGLYSCTILLQRNTNY